MPAARPETLIMRQAREMARDDGLRVTVVHYPDGRLSVEIAPPAVDVDASGDVASPDGENTCDRAFGVLR